MKIISFFRTVEKLKEENIEEHLQQKKCRDEAGNKPEELYKIQCRKHIREVMRAQLQEA